MPPSRAPLMIVHGLRCPCHMQAKSTLGDPGWISRSAAPAESEMCSTFFHVLPPSDERKMPRSGLSMNGLPSAATYTRSGFDGCTRTVEICPTSRRPENVHVFPASTDL